MFRLLATLTTGIMLSTSVQAQDAPWFEVELYIFSHPTNSTEQWSDSVNVINTQSALDFITPLINPAPQSAMDDNQTNCKEVDWGLNPNLCSEKPSSEPTNMLSRIPVSIAAPSAQQAFLDLDNVLLSESQSQFANYIASISREPGHESLLHMTWQQAMQPRHSARAIRIFAGKDYSQEFTLDGQPLIQSLNDLDAYAEPILDSHAESQSLTLSDTSVTAEFGALETTEQKQDETIPVWQLDGKMNIYLNHYLYVETELNYRDVGSRKAPLALDAATIGTGNSQATTVAENNQLQSIQPSEFLFALPMVQSRRVRSGEVHYLDHPRLGIIVQIRKMTQPETVAQYDGTSNIMQEEDSRFSNTAIAE